MSTSTVKKSNNNKSLLNIFSSLFIGSHHLKCNFISNHDSLDLDYDNIVFDDDDSDQFFIHGDAISKPIPSSSNVLISCFATNQQEKKCTNIALNFLTSDKLKDEQSDLDDGSSSIILKSSILGTDDEVYIDNIHWDPQQYILSAHVYYGILDFKSDNEEDQNDDGNTVNWKISQPISIQGFLDSKINREAVTKDCFITSNIKVKFQMIQFSQDGTQWNAVLTLTKCNQ